MGNLASDSLSYIVQEQIVLPARRDGVELSAAELAARVRDHFADLIRGRE